MCKIFLQEFGIDIVSHVTSIGGVTADTKGLSFSDIKKAALHSPMHCADKAAEKKMMARVDEAQKKKDTIGGIFEVVVTGVPVGLGSFVHYDRRLTAKLAAAVMSIQAVKGVEFGMGFGVSKALGREVHDEIFHDAKKGFYRRSNNAGGLEGGVTNGEDLVVRAATKPYATLMSPMSSVNIESKKKEVATVERSDVTAVPACGVVGEAMVAFEIANALTEKFGGDSLKEMKRNFDGYKKQIADF